MRMRMRELTSKEAREFGKYTNWGFTIYVYDYDADENGTVGWTWVIKNLFGVVVDYGFADTKEECEVEVKIAKAQAVLRGEQQ
jgi:hypothetical protein